ncbi:hypothetical protein N7474_009465 [Penicillium riverlandense]|uniref:uncharacterized protein n=1 Tax=Penicillium riverlandense TaxID=1903569 RepID=UPI002547FC66|nr:uncharacterized protein N7474_009465 [Penicillium riverlandense]KAJ5808196.1 hypothetical protein N7474_009465 [Penicillium riverlandense]
MTREGPLRHAPGEGVASQRELPPAPPERENVLATSNPPSIASTQTARTANDSTRGQAASNAKVAIPRQRAGIAPRFNRRVPRACESCRQRKTKCSGDTPVCRQCRELRVTCQYPVGWKERTKKQVERLSEKAADYENLLKDLGSMVETKAAERIKILLDKVQFSVPPRPKSYTNKKQYGSEPDYSSNSNPSHSVTPQDVMDAAGDEPSSPSSIGSLEAIDRVEEDLNRDENTRATGYLGKNSEITWMQRVQQEAEQRAQGKSGRKSPTKTDQNPDGDFTLHTVNYHLDDMDISAPGPVQTYYMPPRQLADQLFEDYLNTVHPFFPIINRPLFWAQYQTFYDSAARPGDKWLAILNMIFAISAKHAHLMDAPWRGDSHDHLVYLTRARILSMNGDVLFSHPDLQQVQVEGLIAFYLLSSDQINRAWRISALAVRSAITLGINMKNSSTSTPNVSKEARYRVWWCLYTFEHTLGIMTGRATCIQDGVCTSPLPLPFDEDQLDEPAAAEVLNDSTLRDDRINSVMASSWIRHMPLNPANGREATKERSPESGWLLNLPVSLGLVYLYYCDLTVVAQEIVNRVYSVDCVMVPWPQMENRIGELKARIDLWYSLLPPALDFTRKEDEGADLLRGKLSLAFHYYSARISLGRPCLCQRDAAQKSPTQKPTFSHEMAVISLESATRMLDLIPDEPNAVQLYQICPWWCILHYLMQAATVLLLELSFACIHVPSEEANFIQMAKKSIRWLYAMSHQSVASRRAWQLCDVGLRRLAVGMKLDVSDMPSDKYQTELEIPQNATRSEDISHQQPPPQSGDFWGPHVESQMPMEQDYLTYPAMSTSELLSSLTTEAQSGGSYFPYDPIGGEFIRSFFPDSTEDGHNWQ